MAWKRLVKRAGLVNLRFHDLRHEAIGRFFEKGLNVPEVALIAGTVIRECYSGTLTRVPKTLLRSFNRITPTMLLPAEIALIWQSARLTRSPTGPILCPHFRCRGLHDLA